MAFVTLDQAKGHLYIDEDYDNDADLQMKIEAAESIIKNYLHNNRSWLYLDSNGDAEVDSNGDEIVRPEVIQATLLLIGILYKDREGSVGWGQGYLPFHITALIYQLRDPAYA